MKNIKIKKNVLRVISTISAMIVLHLVNLSFYEPKIIQYWIYGFMFVSVMTHFFVYKGRLSGDDDKPLGLFSWFQENIWNEEYYELSSKTKVRYIIELLLLYVAILIAVVTAFEQLNYNWLFWLIIIFTFFTVTGLGIFVLTARIYIYVHRHIFFIWTFLNKIYLFHICRSVKKIERNANRFSVSRAWMRILKVGSLDESLRFVQKRISFLKKEDYLSVNVAKILISKIKKENMSYQLSLFLLIIDWFVEFKNTSISLLKINPDQFVALNQKLFDTIVDNLPTYKGSIYLNLKAGDATMADVLKRLYTESFVYMNDSKAKRVEEIKEVYLRDCNEASILLSEASKQLKECSKNIPKGGLYVVDKTLFQRETEFYEKIANHLYVSPEEIISLADEMDVLYKSINKEQMLKNIISKAETINVFSRSYYAYEFSFLDKSNINLIVHNHLKDFLENFDPSVAIIVNVVATKGEVDFDWVSIETFLNYLFRKLKTSREDLLIKKLVKAINETFVFLSNFSYNPLTSRLYSLKESWFKSNLEIAKMITYPNDYNTLS